MTKRDKNSNNEKKRGFPGGFLLLVLAVVLVILTFQNLSSEKKAKVSFSHQIEHLVNLDLIHPDESRKIGLGDNLVTFSGRFKDQLSHNSEDRYRYLDLLNQNHQMQVKKEDLSQDLVGLEKNIDQAADTFFHLTGQALPKEGFQVIDSTYDSQNRINAVTLTSLSNKSMVSIPNVAYLQTIARENPTSQNVSSVGQELELLIQNFLSPSLGIGSESLKASLRDLQKRIEKTSSTSVLTPGEKLTAYSTALKELQKLSEEIAKPIDHVRLLPLRSVRNYLEYLKEYNTVLTSLDQNVSQLDKARDAVSGMIWFYNNKELSTKALERESPEEFNQWFTQAKNEWGAFQDNSSAVFKAPDQPRSAVLEKRFKSEEPSPNYLSYLFTFLPILLIVMLLYFVFSRQMKGVGSQAMNFGKSPARMLNKSTLKITFKDVAGVEEAKEELQEIVDFLKDPGKFTALGARIPKGVLCVGPPGTGKTLIAKAVAGEADCPFFSISGSDFVEMFVGVGASRIRDLFEQAKKSAPCIIFIDEIDAVGRHRGAGIGGGHDEREQTLNQLLVEMDGFDTNEGVILMAATNRPDVLDKALLRPGRFDRRIVLDLPDIKGRFEILKVHARRIKLDEKVELMDIARATPGSSGADLQNILNEAALLAARRGRSMVTEKEAKESCDKVIYGKERRSLELDKNEKLTTAYHESGHAIVGLVVEHADPVEKVTIIPRGFSLGATYFLPKKNRVNYWRKELLDHLAVAMGGRIAEEIFVKDISSGAQMDIAQATRLARAMVCEWGMTDTLGAVAYDSQLESNRYLMPGSAPDRHYSEQTLKAIDDEVKALINESNQRARDIITEHKEALELMTQMLMEFETLDKEDVQLILKGEWDEEKKRDKMKDSEEAHRKLPPPPPKDFTEDVLDIDPTPA
ncbi:MAG: ATP-dependent zinc metalloprotease FtsH [Simkaniaceae bacterium]